MIFCTKCRVLYIGNLGTRVLCDECSYVSSTKNAGWLKRQMEETKIKCKPGFCKHSITEPCPTTLTDDDHEYIRTVLLLHTVDLEAKRKEAEHAAKVSLGEMDKDIEYVKSIRAKLQPTSVEAVEHE